MKRETSQTRDPEQLRGGEVGVFFFSSFHSVVLLKIPHKPQRPPFPRFLSFLAGPRVRTWREGKEKRTETPWRFWLRAGVCSWFRG